MDLSTEKMRGFWPAALTVGGLGAVGAFVFWSLYKNWLSLPIFERLTSDQTFYLMVGFLILTFASLVSILFAYVETKRIERPSELADARIKKEAHVALVEVLIEEKELNTELDLKLRNPSDQVVYIKAAEFKVLDQWDFKMWQAPYAVPVSSKYDVNIPAEPGKVVRKAVSQGMPPKSVDRFVLSLATDHKNYPFTGLSLFFSKCGSSLMKTTAY